MDNSFNNLDVALHAYLDASDMPKEHFDTLMWALFSPDEGIVTFGGDLPANLPAVLRDAIQNVINTLEDDDEVDNFQEWMNEFDQAYFGQQNGNQNDPSNNDPSNNSSTVYLSNSNNNNPTGGKRRKTRKTKKSKKSRKSRKTRKSKKSKKSRKSKKSKRTRRH
jgi:hypothetical protein